MKNLKLTKQLIVKYLILAFAFVAIVLAFFPLVKFSKLETVVKLNGFELIFGKVFNESIISTLKFNFGVFFSYLLFVGCAVLQLINVKRFEYFKNLVSIFVFMLGFVLLYEAKDFVVVQSSFTESGSYTVIGKLLLIILLIILALSVVNFFINKYEDTPYEIIKYVKIGLLLLIFLGLIFKIASFATSTALIELKGFELAFGKKLTRTMFQISETPAHLDTILAYAFVLIALIMSVLSLLFKKRVFKFLSFFAGVYSLFYFISARDVVFSYYKYTYMKAFNFYGLFSIVLSLLFVVFNIIELSKENLTKQHYLMMASGALIAFILASIYLPSFYCYQKITTAVYNKTYVSFFETLKGIEVLGHDTHPALLIASYGFALLALVLVLIKTDYEKIKYLLATAISVAAVVIFLSAKQTVFHALEHSSYYFANNYGVGIVILIIFIAMPAFFLYMSAITPLNQKNK